MVLGYLIKALDAVVSKSSSDFESGWGIRKDEKRYDEILDRAGREVDDPGRATSTWRDGFKNEFLRSRNFTMQLKEFVYRMKSAK